MRQIKNQSGQGLLEYLILLALVVIVSVGITKSLGSKINGKFRELRDHIDSGIPVNLNPGREGRN